MNSASIDNVSAMDVKIESQPQLVSRIQLATDSHSRLSFLHGPSGVGKSYVAALIQEKLSRIIRRLGFLSFFKGLSVFD